MLNLVVCVKQVPMAAELPWDSKTRTLKRETAEGMLDPSSRHALEAALRIKQRHGGRITAITMGPAMAEEVLHEACAMGADRGLLLTDRAMAGADTSVTADTLARAILSQCPSFDLIFCGSHTSDSETAQVGPQLAEALEIPGIAYVRELRLKDKVLWVQRLVDHFMETLEMDLPGLVTVTPSAFHPRYAPLEGLQSTFEKNHIIKLGAADLGIDKNRLGTVASPTRIIDVYSPVAEKMNIVLTGSTKSAVEALFEQFDDVIGGAIGKDLKGGDGYHE